MQAEHPNVIGELAITELKIRKKGYLYVYVNNSSVKPVFFDNLIISHTSSKLLEENNYYPFGMLWKAPIGDNKYKYSGKEIQTELDLFTQDYGARYYDPAIGRFGTVDPLAHKMPAWSPYSFCNNNPIRYIDPDGRAP
ncbi:MAG: RHS repeat-associated core domain-containing protein [Bacteroidetes bacterium]|nr:MAG: RHS repeat-associated core domain-containing protein [Bacteroidota bacterium]REK06453.1 MAG: RHS repeat-associated core domain-containing protein [Bacteroidota bacterium]REK33219.1 MAG: RHS repeat-associated core domain-containing protein [Bacteroidota bacterium]REK47056.1 MAG: RHS repeat-associated core domain-containing protein [Bacteroidota bacterium]